MDSHALEKKPTWWLLYTIGATLTGVVGLLEISVMAEASVAAMFARMLCWLRVNRGRIELAEARATRAHAFGLVIQIPGVGAQRGRKISASRLRVTSSSTSDARRAR